ncbi:MAG: precorrin-6y C5,15-methyltransferase (decarboxylating) subunit CbiE [Xenococcaceae cyanobacterium]
MREIEVIGIGLDGAAGLALSVQKIIAQATILVGSNRHLNYFPNHPAKKIILNNLQKNIKEIQQLVKQNEYITILTSGDPLFFGLGRLLLEQFPQEHLKFHPHLSSIQLAFSRLKIPWQDAQFISVHGRDVDELIKVLRQGKEKIAILTDNTNNPSAIARLYLSLNLPIEYTFWLFENFVDQSERINSFNSEEINQLAHLSETNFANLNVLILSRKDPQNTPFDSNNLPILGLSEKTFKTFRDRHGLITKKEIRLLILGELALQAKQIVWDLGAGTGSVSIEIARLCPNSQIYAIEKTAIGISLIEENCQNLKVDNIHPICGNAENILQQLPSPDRIFIGGSNSNIVAILDICKQKIVPQGRLVIALATIENCHQAIDWFKQNNWYYSLLQVQISRSIPIATLTRFTPLNPVTTITAHPLYLD